MSQFGMQMPGGGQGARKALPDVYTALMLFSFLALATAAVFVWMAGERVGPDGNAMKLQEDGRVKLADMPRP